MDWLSERAVLRASCIWRSGDDEPWLVSFDFAEVGGRLECVGCQLRSFLEGEDADQLGAYRSYLTAKVSRTDLLPTRAELPKPKLSDPAERAAYLQALEDWESQPPSEVLFDADAVDALLHEPQAAWDPKESPRPLRSATLRELPLGQLLVRVRRRLAEDWRSGLIAPRRLAASALGQTQEEASEPLPALTEEQIVIAHAREELEAQTWELLSLVRKRGGYDDELLRRRDEIAQRFAELDAHGHPERERGAQIWRQIEAIDDRLGELTADVAAGENQGDAVAELLARRSELEDAQLGREDQTEPMTSRRSIAIDTQQFLRLTRQAASSFSFPGQKAGRPAHYSLAQLELVAKTYREAYRSGSSSPTKDVASKLGMSRSRAAKLIMRCRDPRIGLLAPTQKRRAGESERSQQTRSGE